MAECRDARNRRVYTAIELLRAASPLCIGMPRKASFRDPFRVFPTAARPKVSIDQKV